jgi:hypothetical protein
VSCHTRSPIEKKPITSGNDGNAYLEWLPIRIRRRNIGGAIDIDLLKIDIPVNIVINPPFILSGMPLLHRDRRLASGWKAHYWEPLAKVLG